MGRGVVGFVVGLAVVGAAIFVAVYVNRASHLDLKGEILKVRTLADGDGTIVFADFRVTNAASIPFVVSSVKMTMETPENEVATAVIFSKFDVERVSRYLKLLGPAYNDVLTIRDKIPPVSTVDRMAAGRFNFPAKFLQQRKTLRLRIEEVDGIASEIIESTPGEVTVRVKVVPRSKKNEVSGELTDGTLKVHVTAAPEKGKANEQVCAVLAAHYKVPVRAVQIVTGHGNPRKLVRIDVG